MNKLTLKLRKNPSTWRHLRLFVLFLSFLFLFGLLGAAIVSTYDQTVQKDKQLASLQEEVNKEEQKNESLLSQKNYYKSDTFIEKEARNTLGLSYPNEEIYVFKRSPTQSPNIQNSNSSDNKGMESIKPAKTIIDKWLDLLFGS